MKTTRDAGASINAIAKATGKDWATVRRLLTYAETGILPPAPSQVGRAKRPKHSVAGDRQLPPYQRYAAEVSELRTQHTLSWKRIAGLIAERHGISFSPGTAVRAFDHAHPKVIREAAASGYRPNRGRGRALAPDVVANLRRHMARHPDWPDLRIAKAVGCGYSTVARERRRLANDAAR